MNDSEQKLSEFRAQKSIDQAINYPYDAPDIFWNRVQARNIPLWQKRAARAVIADLWDRPAFRAVLEGLNQEIRRVLIKDLTAVIRLSECTEWKNPNQDQPIALEGSYLVMLREDNSLGWTHENPVIAQYGWLGTREWTIYTDLENVNVTGDVKAWREAPRYYDCPVQPAPAS